MAHRSRAPTRAQSTRSTRVVCSVSRPAGGGVATGSSAHYLLGVAVVVVGLCVVEARHPPSRQAGFVAGPFLAGPPRTHSHVGWKQHDARTAKFLPLEAPRRGRILGLNSPVPQTPASDAAGKKLGPLPMPRLMKPALPAQTQCPQAVATRSEEVRERNLGEKLAAGYTAGLVAKPLQTKMLTNLASAVMADMIKQARLPLCRTTEFSQVGTVIFFISTFATWTFLNSHFYHFRFLRKRPGLSRGWTRFLRARQGLSLSLPQLGQIHTEKAMSLSPLGQIPCMHTPLGFLTRSLRSELKRPRAHQGDMDRS